MVGDFLRRQGHEVTTVLDGGTGLEAVAQKLPDLVLCDLDMPGMNGQGVVTSLRHDDRFTDLPVLFLSGCTDRGEIRRTMNLGADDFLSKPVDLQEVLDAVNARLGWREKRRQLEERRVESAVEYVAGVIHDLDGVSGEGAENHTGQILAGVRDRLHPANGPGAVTAQSAFLGRAGSGQQLVKLSEVRIITAYGEYSQAHWGRERHLLIRKALKSWVGELPAGQFIRVHRQAIVNLAFLERVERVAGKISLRLRDYPDEVTVSQRATGMFNRRLKQYQQSL